MSQVAERRKAEKAEARRDRREAKRRERGANGLRAQPEDQRPQRERLLIVCEGARTEPNYFKEFPVSAYVKILGEGMNTLSLVEHAITIRDNDGDYSEVWAVFDRDSFPLKDFNEAVALARRKSIRVAWSNEAFELWYLLHFEYCDANNSRTTYKKRLTNYLGRPYKKKDVRIYDLLEARQAEAMRNARKLLSHHAECTIDDHLPANMAPGTTVHLLVKRLRELSK